MLIVSDLFRIYPSDLCHLCSNLAFEDSPFESFYFSLYSKYENIRNDSEDLSRSRRSIGKRTD